MTRVQLLPLLAVLLALPAAPGPARQSTTVDCVVAVVGPRVISLTDVRLAEAFGVFDTAGEAEPGRRRRLILEKLIDQKVVVNMARESVPVGADKVEKAWTDLIGRLGREKARALLESFGAESVD